MYKIVLSSLIAVNGMLTSHCDNLSTHHYLNTFDMQFRHGQTTQCFRAVAMSSKKEAKAIKQLFCAKESGKKKKGNSFSMDWADKHAASNKGSYYKQHEFEEGQHLEEAAIVSSSHMKLLSKAMLGSDDEVNKSEVFNGKQRGDENWQMLRGKAIVSGETLVKNLDRAVACCVCHADVTLDSLN